MVDIIDNSVGKGSDTVVTNVPEPPAPQEIDRNEVYGSRTSTIPKSNSHSPQAAPITPEYESQPRYRRETPVRPLGGVRQNAIDKVTALKDDFITLYRQEIALAKTEVKEGASKVKASAGSIITGVVLAIAGFSLLLGAATTAVTWLCMTFGLGLMPALLIGFLSVGLLSMLIGYLAIKGGQKKLENSNLNAPKTQETLRRSKEIVGEQPTI